MFNLRRVFAFWAVVPLLLGAAGSAQAQTTPPTGGTVTVTLPATGVSRDHQDRVSTTPITQINYKDCVTNDEVTFSLNLGTGYAQYALEIWAGDSCDTKATRTPATTATCWKVPGGGQPNSITYTVTVKVQDILYGRTGGNTIGDGSTDGTSGTGGTDATGGNGGGADTGGTDSGGGGTGGSNTVTNEPPPGAPKECVLTSAVVAPQTIGVYFLLVNGAQDSFGGTSWKATYKLSASAPPDHVSATTGENIAPISWSYDSTNVDTYINGYQFYCDPAPNADLADAGIVPDPDVVPICQDTTALIPGTLPDENYKCGTAGRTATHGNATGLVNNVAYHVAVASTDTYLNVGNISETTCAVPQQVTGFFEAYRNAGGQGGGGFCSFSPQRRPAVLFTMLGLGLCLVLRRRRAT